MITEEERRIVKETKARYKLGERRLRIMEINLGCIERIRREIVIVNSKES